MSDTSKASFKVKGGSHSLASMIGKPSITENKTAPVTNIPEQPSVPPPPTRTIDNVPPPPKTVSTTSDNVPPPPPRRTSIAGDGAPPPPPPRRPSVITESQPELDQPELIQQNKPNLSDFPPSPIEVVNTPTSSANSSNKFKTTTPTNSSSNSKLCNICSKTVYKMEEVLALNTIYHKSCFKCGGHNSDGCSKVLTLDKYVDHENQPYCNSCYNKLFRPKGFGYSNTLNLDSGSRPIEPDVRSTSPVNKTGSFLKPQLKNVSSTEPDARATSPINPSSGSFVKPQLKNISSNSKIITSDSIYSSSQPPEKPSRPVAPSAPTTKQEAPKSVSPKPVPIPEKKPEINKPIPPVAKPNPPKTGLVAPKCTICATTVYKMEEVIAVGHTWHKTCFKCGGRNNDGCGKVLTLDGYLDHDNEPYCNNCYNKQFRPKGFGNSLNLDQSPRSADSNVNNVQKSFQASSISKSNTTKPVAAKSIAIGSKAGTLHTEATFVGDGDEVDEGEW